MGALIRAKDWGETSLGNPENWPQSLRTIVAVMLDNPFGMYIAWGREYIQLYNDGYRPILGSTKHPQALGISSRETFAEIWHIIDAMFDGVMQGKAVGFPDFMLPLDRHGYVEECYFDFSYSPIRQENGEVGGVLVTVIETTSKKKTEKDLQESEERFRNMADNIPNLAWMANADGWIYWYNKKWYEYTGTLPEQMEGWGWQSVHDPQTLHLVLDKWQGSIANGQPFDMVFPLKGADGEFRQFLTRVLPLRDGKGKVSQWFGTNTDITDQKKAEEALKESERRFRTMAEGTDILIAVGDETSNAVYFNKAWVELTGKPMEHLLAFGWVDLVHPEDRDRYVNIYLRAFEKKIAFTEECRVLNKDGEYRWLLSKVQPRFNPAGTFAGYISSCLDITELKQTEQALKESEQRFRNVADSAPALIWMSDTDTRCYFFNKGWLKFTGRTMEQESGSGWTAGIHPDDLQACLDSYISAFHERQEFYVEYRLQRQDGEYRWISDNGVPRFTADGIFEGYIGACMDIQEQKSFSVELEKQVKDRTNELALANHLLTDKNLELENMNKELQSFAYISSHDLQEPLRKIQTFSSRLMDKEYENLSESGKDNFQRMQNAANRMQTLIDDLLAYSRTNTVERKFENVDLKKIIDDVKEDLKEEIQQKHATIEATDSCEINIILFQFRQLIYNLVSNSLKFSDNDRPPRIRISSKIAKGINLQQERLAEEVKYCHIRISDNGIGFKQQYSEKIFEVFQRLHGRSEYIGTGIGLAIVKKIVENHHGIITAKGNLNQGATFDIYIPVT